jgi:hypothetical protein
LSRSRARLLALIAIAYAALPVSAQEVSQGAADRKVDAMVTTARQAYGPAAPAKRSCNKAADGDEIVVCAPDHGEQWRVPSTSESDPGSREALNDGLPRAPELGRGSCRGQAGCMIGGYAPPPVYMIDLKAIPEAPEDSDADKVAKGEMSDR